MNGVSVVVVVNHHRRVSFYGRCFGCCYNLCYNDMGIIVVFTLLIVMILITLSRVSFDGIKASVVAHEWRTCHVFIALHKRSTETTAVVMHIPIS